MEHRKVRGSASPRVLNVETGANRVLRWMSWMNQIHSFILGTRQNTFHTFLSINELKNSAKFASILLYDFTHSALFKQCLTC